jgi:hypothetical protein
MLFTVLSCFCVHFRFSLDVLLETVRLSIATNVIAIKFHKPRRRDRSAGHTNNTSASFD